MEELKETNARKGVIDTAAPFDSVKAAVNMFGGVIGWRARKVVGLEKDADTQSEFQKVQEEISKYKKQSEAAQTAKLQVLEELDITKKLIEELKDRLEKTETQVAQAKLNSHVSYSASAQEELKSVKEELESLSVDYHRIITERDLGIASAQGALLAAKDAEKKVENLKEELRLLIDQKLAANDCKAKLQTEPDLAFHVQGENDGNKQKTSTSELASAKRDAEEVKASIKKATDEVKRLRSEIEQQTKNISALKQREGVASASVSSLEAEIRKMQSELESALAKEREAREKMERLPKMIEQATHDADQAKSLACLACKELRNAKEESEQVMASASAMEDKLVAAVKEIEAAKTSEALAVAAVKAMAQSREFPMENGVKLGLEEYYTLTKSAHYAEELGNQKVMNAAKKIEEAKNSELVEMNKLEQVQKELKEKKAAVKAAEEMAEKAAEGKLVAEREFKDCACKAEISHRRIASEVVASHYEKKRETKRRAKRASSLSCPDFKDHMMAEVKPRKKSFFPRIVMFFARRKAQSPK